jgi:hypothetical protein
MGITKEGHIAMKVNAKMLADERYRLMMEQYVANPTYAAHTKLSKAWSEVKALANVETAK